MSDLTADTPDTDDEGTEMKPVSTSSATRRSVMVGSATALAAAAAGLATSETAEAATGDDMKLGEENDADEPTRLSGPSFIVTDGEVEGSLSRVAGNAATGTSTTAVYGVTTGNLADTDDVRAVYGLDDTADGVGVYGLHGEAAGPGTGVVGESADGPGLSGRGSEFDLVLQRSGRMNFVPAGVLASNSLGRVGTLAHSDDGSLWFATDDNEWQKIAGSGASSTFTPIEPTRAYDSRSPNPAPGALGAGGERRVSVLLGRDLETGAITDLDLVPDGSTAVSYNVTIARTVGEGFLTVAPGDAAVAKASSINWTDSGQTIANAGIVQVDDDGAVKVFVGGAGAATDFIIDVTGYYS